jgi:hypothetical protein
MAGRRSRSNAAYEPDCTHPSRAPFAATGRGAIAISDALGHLTTTGMREVGATVSALATDATYRRHPATSHRCVASQGPVGYRPS